MKSFKTVRFYLPLERMWKDLSVIICIVEMQYRFFYGGMSYDDIGNESA